MSYHLLLQVERVSCSPTSFFCSNLTKHLIQVKNRFQNFKCRHQESKLFLTSYHLKGEIITCKLKPKMVTLSKLNFKNPLIKTTGST